MRGFHWSPLWSSGQSSWLQIQRSGFDSQRYHIFWEVVGLERGSLSLVSTTEELFIIIIIIIINTNCNWAYARWQCYINNEQYININT
jgi:hypothetical protein